MQDVGGVRMLDLNGKKLHDLINKLQEQDTKLTDALKKIVGKYSNDNTTLQEVVFFYKAVYTNAISFQCFCLLSWSYEIDMKKADELFEKSFEELIQFKPKGFPLKRVKKLTTQIDELDDVMKKHQIQFWNTYCIPVLKRKNKDEIWNFAGDNLFGEGMQYLKSILYEAHYELEKNNTKEYNDILTRRVFI